VGAGRGLDVSGARYKNGIRESPQGDQGDYATLTRMHDKEGVTLQLLQPQRWIDPLWRLLAALEAQLACLVGCK